MIKFIFEFGYFFTFYGTAVTTDDKFPSHFSFKADSQAMNHIEGMKSFQENPQEILLL